MKLQLDTDKKNYQDRRYSKSWRINRNAESDTS